MTNLEQEQIAPQPESLQPDSAETPPPKKKRNCGRTGAISIAGRQRCSKNAIKHGSTAHALILGCESIQAWEALLARWCREYKISPEEQAAEDSIDFDTVRRTAQAEWHRIRCQRNYDDYLFSSLNGRPPFNWTSEETKLHDLHLRYKNAAERTFHRELRALQTHFKLKQQEQAKTTRATNPKSDPDSVPTPAKPSHKLNIIGVDPTSPTGYTVYTEIIDGVKTSNPRPFTPPDPLPPDWPKFHLPPPKSSAT